MLIWITGAMFTAAFDRKSYEDLEYPVLIPFSGYVLFWPVILGDRLGKYMQEDYLLKQKQLEE